jgi:hypothetical protein
VLGVIVPIVLPSGTHSCRRSAADHERAYARCRIATECRDDKAERSKSIAHALRYIYSLKEHENGPLTIVACYSGNAHIGDCYFRETATTARDIDFGATAETTVTTEKSQTME